MGDGFDVHGWLRALFSTECQLGSLETLVMVALIRHASASGEAFPGLGTLARETRLSRRRVVQAVAELEGLGLIRRTKHRRGAGFASNTYALADLGSASRALVQAVHHSGSAPRAHTVVHHVRTGSAPRAHELPIELPNGTIGGAQPKTRTSKSRSSKPRRATGIETWTGPTKEHLAFVAEHGLDLELELRAFRGHYENELCKSWHGRFTTWLANAVKFQRERERRGGARRGVAVQHGVVDETEAASWGQDGAARLLGGAG